MAKKFISKILAMALVVSVALSAIPVQAAEGETPPLGDSAAIASPGAAATPSDTVPDPAIQLSAAMTGTFGEEDNLTWALEENEEDGSADLTYTLTISGTGEIYYLEDDSPWVGFTITAVVIEEGITSIGDSAFRGEARLVDISLPDGLEEIGPRAFAECESLTEIVIPDSVRILGHAAFYKCINLTSVTLSEIAGLSFFENPFTVCPGLADEDGFVIFSDMLYGYYGEAEHVTIPDGVRFIGDGAFLGNTNLTGVTIPDGVEIICDGAFDVCENLTSVEMPDDVQLLGDGAFSGCEGLADEDGFVIVKGLLYNYYGDGGAVIIPEGVTEIGYQAFFGLDDITAVTLPDSLMRIRGSAFYYCYGLTGVSIPRNVEIIDDWAFSDCTGLKNVTFNGGAPTIDSNAFDGVTATVVYPPMLSWTDRLQDYGGDLTWVSADPSLGGLTWSIEENGRDANGYLTYALIISGTGPMESYDFEESFPPWYDFNAQYSVTEVIIKSGVTSIGAFAFADLNVLTGAEIPDSVTEIGGWAFWGCGNLAGIEIPAGVTSIGEYAFSACESLTGVTIPAGVTVIREGAFESSGLTGVDIPDSVLSIEDAAFDYCGSLTYADIGDGVTHIGWQAFHACQSLNSVTFGKSISEIGEYAFSGEPKSLESITFTGDAPADIASNAFMNITSTVYYPALPSWTPDKLQNYQGRLTWVVSANLPQSAPSGIGKTDETAAGANDGAITGVTPAMEYKKQGEASYIPIDGTSVTGLAPGTYLVRCAAKLGYDASPDTVVVIVAYSAPDLYPVTLHQAQGGTASASHTGAAGGEIVSLSVLSLNTGYSFVRWDTAPSVTWTAGNAGVRNASFAMPDGGVTVTPVYQYRGVAVTGDNGGNDDDSDRDSGSSSSGGRGGGTGTAAPPETWLGAGDTKQPGKSAGRFGVRGSAWAGLPEKSYYHDTVAGNIVQVRLYIENPSFFTKDAYLSGYVTGVEVNSTRNIFEKWYQNKIQVVHFDQEGQWEQPVAVAAKLDLSMIDVKRLCFYAYDKKTNKYARIAEPAYWIDQNGYLHFKTPFAGDVIVSEGELVKTAAAGEFENVSA